MLINKDLIGLSFPWDTFKDVLSLTVLDSLLEKYQSTSLAIAITHKALAFSIVCQQDTFFAFIIYRPYSMQQICYNNPTTKFPPVYPKPQSFGLPRHMQGQQIITQTIQ